MRILVKDTGQGIAPEFLPHVFDRFRQADPSTTRGAWGLGIGLSITKHLVELHGGSIEASSQGLDLRVRPSSSGSRSDIRPPSTTAQRRATTASGQRGRWRGAPRRSEGAGYGGTRLRRSGAHRQVPLRNRAGTRARSTAPFGACARQSDASRTSANHLGRRPSHAYSVGMTHLRLSPSRRLRAPRAAGGSARGWGCLRQHNPAGNCTTGRGGQCPAGRCMSRSIGWRPRAMSRPARASLRRRGAAGRGVITRFVPRALLSCANRWTL